MTKFSIHDLDSTSSILRTIAPGSSSGGSNVYATEDYSEWLMSKYLERMIASGISLVSHRVVVNDTIESFFQNRPDDIQVVPVREGRGCFFWKDCFGQYSSRNHGVILFLYGPDQSVKDLKSSFSNRFQMTSCHIKWIYDPQHLDYIMIPLQSERLPFESMYPFLNGTSLKDYYDGFLKSSSNILILIGPPGTGKTSFIRGLLSTTESSASLTYQEKILEQDGFFAQWLEGEDTFMIMEDSDHLLKAREDGNNLMARFLNVGDGLIAFKNKKLIFSTNLPNTKHIDEALLRPGRCYDILEFSHLNLQQAQQVAQDAGIAFQAGDKTQFTIADIFSQNNKAAIKKINKPMGFY